MTGAIKTLCHFKLFKFTLALSHWRTLKKMVYTPEQVVPTEKSLLWKVSANGLKKPSYVYGTIHLIPKDKLEFGEATRKALDGTQRIAFEIDMKEMTNMRMQIGLMTKAFMAGGAGGSAVSAVGRRRSDGGRIVTRYGAEAGHA